MNMTKRKILMLNGWEGETHKKNVRRKRTQHAIPRKL
jgi:hypothetical protein